MKLMKLIGFLNVFDDSHEVIELWQDNEYTNDNNIY